MSRVEQRHSKPIGLNRDCGSALTYAGKIEGRVLDDLY